MLLDKVSSSEGEDGEQADNHANGGREVGAELGDRGRHGLVSICRDELDLDIRRGSELAGLEGVVVRDICNSGDGHPHVSVS